MDDSEIMLESHTIKKQKTLQQILMKRKLSVKGKISIFYLNFY